MNGARDVSVDLAYERARDVGVCVLERRTRELHVEFVALADAAGGADPPRAEWVADACVRLARERGARLLLLDGPQAWKDVGTGLAHARACERAIHAPAKTGLPGRVKPRPYRAFVAFSIAVFDALHARGWPRLEADGMPRGRRALEVFPHEAWRRLGLDPLPAKRKCTPQRLAACTRALAERMRVRMNRAPGYDELQALVAGVAGLSLLERDARAYEVVGLPPRLRAGLWREGFVLLPRPSAPKRTAETRCAPSTANA